MTTKTSYSITGLSIGLIIGCMAGVGELNYIKKSQRGSVLPFALIIGGVAGAAVGASIGYRLGRTLHIEKITGIDSAQTTFSQQGRFWIGTTILKDTRSNSDIRIVTVKSSSKTLVTELNGQRVIAHDTNSASRVSVEKFHKQARYTIFSKLKELFVEESPTDLTSLF